MELQSVIASIREGDTQAFGSLVARYRDMAFGYALSLVPQEQMAEDAVQDALVTAYSNLDRLREPDAFGAWLRGIVRHHCFRTLRQRVSIRLEDADQMQSGQGSDPLGAAVENSIREQVRRAIEDLPIPLQNVVRLRYDNELSHQDIATRLNLTGSTVNMRLHTARTRLKRRLQTLMEITQLRDNAGAVLESNGPLVLLQFAADSVPPLFSCLSAEDTEEMVVVQHLTEGRIRAVAAREEAIWTPGQAIQDTGQPFTQPLADGIVQRVIDALPVPPPDAARVASGIKTIEVFAPLIQAGKAGLFAEWGVGVLVLLPELLRNLDGHENRQTFYVFVPPLRDVEQWRELTREITSGTSDIRILYLPVADPIAPSFVDRLRGLDSTLVLSRRLAEQAIWPSLDPLRCWSRQPATNEPSSKPAALAENVRRLLRDYYRLQFSLEETDCHALSHEQQQQIHRGRRALRFLAQPFFVAEPYTGRPGAFVTTEEAIQGLEDILVGRYDAAPAEALYMIGAAPRE